MSQETDRKTDFEEAYRQAFTAWSAWQTRARADLIAVVKNAWTAKDIQYMKKVMPEREIMSFGRLRPLVRLISNFERMNRLSIRYAPAEGNDVLTASEFTACANHALARKHGYHVKSECFDHSLKTGISLHNMAIDRHQDIIYEKYGYNGFVLHPGFTQRDLSDCQYGIIRKDIPPSEAKMMFPGSEDLVDHLNSKEPSFDGKFPYRARMELYGRHLLTVDEWTRRTTVQKRYFIDARAGGFVLDGAGNRIEYTDTPEQRWLLMNSPTMDVMEDWERTVEVTQYLNGEEVYHGIDPWKIGDFSFTPFICFFDPEVEDFQWRIQSAVRGITDAQRTFDRRTIANIRTLEAVIGAGLDVEEGALKDEEQAFNAGPGVPRFFTEGAIAEGRFRDRPAPNLPSGWLEMSQAFDNLMGRGLNLDEDGMMGLSAQKDQLLLGVTAKMRMGFGRVGMFDWFDNASLSHEVIGAKLLRLLQQWKPERVARIIGHAPSPAFFQREFEKMDAIPCETPVTDSQRDATYSAMREVNQQYAAVNQPMPFSFDDVLPYMPIALPNEVMQRVVARQKQQQQAQARMAQIQEATQAAMLKQLSVDTANEQIHAQERLANVGAKAAMTDKTQMQTEQIAQEIGAAPVKDAVDRALEMMKIDVQRQQVMAQKQVAKDGQNA